MDRLCLNCGGRYGLHNHMNQRCPMDINAPNDHTEYRESVFAPKPLSSQIDEQLRELGYGPEKVEMRAIALVRTLKENIELKAALKKEEQDHYYTRVAWDRTSAEKEFIKKQKSELIAALDNLIHDCSDGDYLPVCPGVTSVEKAKAVLQKIITPKTKDNESL